MRNHYFPKIVTLLKELKKKYPTLEVARHISTATAEYTDIWGMSDKELFYALERYQLELDVNTPIATDEELSSIIKGGLDLDSIPDEDDY